MNTPDELQNYVLIVVLGWTNAVATMKQSISQRTRSHQSFCQVSPDSVGIALAAAPLHRHPCHLTSRLRRMEDRPQRAITTLSQRPLFRSLNGAPQDRAVPSRAIRICRRRR